MKMRTLVLPPASRLREVCSEECRSLLERHFDPIWNETGRDYTEAELLERLADAEVLLTSWGSPPLTEEGLGRAQRLRYIGHAAGTVKHRLPRAAFGAGVKVFSAAPRIAHSVGELCMALLMASLREVYRFDAHVRGGGWKLPGVKGRELRGKTIGLVSASSTARAFIGLLRPFEVDILVYDPYLSEEAAARLGVRRASLEEVMRCGIVSVHAPNLPSTENLISKELLALLPDGGILINTSRAQVIEEEALRAELASGRFFAALDVFHREPLPEGDPLLAMENVLLTPHVAGATVEGHLALMEEVVRDILRSVQGEATSYEVFERMWDTMA